MYNTDYKLKVTSNRLWFHLCNQQPVTSNQQPVTSTIYKINGLETQVMDELNSTQHLVTSNQ